MDQRHILGIPAIFRLALVVTAGATVYLFYGPTAGLMTVLAGVCILLLIQMYYLRRLSMWLADPVITSLPHGHGPWTAIFARLYRLRRDDERNQAELAEWLTRFREAMARLPDGVAIMDDVLSLEWCNPAAEKHLALNGERDKGMRITNLVRTPEFIDYIVLGRYERPLTLSLRDRELVVHIIPFENRRQILVTHDVTESVRIDTMRRDFIANASHELRTPLTVINGFLEIGVSQPALDLQTRAAHCKLMLEQGKRMQSLVEDMLTLSRLESAEFAVRMEKVAIRPLLEQIYREAMALSCGKHTITLEVDGPDINGSAEELRSAFGNLVSNAVRYTPVGGSIRISWTEQQDKSCFTVHDTGIGISHEHIARLTERFYRVDKSRSRETQGTGLGLAIVKHALLRHNATLSVASQPGLGSTFIVHFPRTEEGEEMEDRSENLSAQYAHLM